MKTVLFLGSSHVGSFKVAYDRMGAAAPFAARFAAAIAADIAFTKVAGGRIVASDHSTLERDSLSFFFGEAAPGHYDHYLDGNRPLADVSAALEQTNGSTDVLIDDVSTIFYVAGTSPCDFLRLGEGAAPMPRALRAFAMERLLGSRYSLRPQIDAIRKQRPQIRHAFIGVPLRHADLDALTAVEAEVVAQKRAEIASTAGSFIFDDVFLPDATVLQSNMLATQARFFEEGRQEAEVFVGVAPTEKDNRHANGLYGASVIESFVSKNAT